MREVVVLLFLLSSVLVTGVFSDYGSPYSIPGLIESVTPAFGNGPVIAPLLAVNVSAAEYLSRDHSGALALVQRIIGNASEPLNSTFVLLKATYSSTMRDKVDALTGLFFDTFRALVNFDIIPNDQLNAEKYAAQLSTKISSSMYDAVYQAIMNLYHCLEFNGLGGALFSLNSAIETATTSDPPATSSTISNYVTPEIVALQAPGITGVISAVDNLAKVLQMAVTEINFSLINSAISSRLPNIAPLLQNFNASADRTNNSVTQTVESLAIDATSAYNSVTSNPWNWNDGNIVNLTTFLANFTALLQINFTEPFNTGIDYVKTNVNASLTKQLYQLAEELDRVYSNISAASVNSTSIFKADCVLHYKTNLLKMPATLSRLGSCIQLEGDSVGVINSHATEALRKAKDDAIKPMNQLQMCREQNIACVEKIFASFENRYQSALTTLTLITSYTTSSLEFVAGRVADCTTAIAAEIQSKAQILRLNFNGCLSYGF